MAPNLAVLQPVAWRLPASCCALHPSIPGAPPLCECPFLPLTSREYYKRLDRPGQLALFHNLTRDFGVQRGEVEAAIAAWQQAAAAVAAGAGSGGGAGAGPGAAGEQAADALGRAAQRLAAASQPLYSRLFVPVSQQPAGIKFLADLRTDLLECVRRQPAGSAPLRWVAADTAGFFCAVSCCRRKSMDCLLCCTFCRPRNAYVLAHHPALAKLCLHASCLHCGCTQPPGCPLHPLTRLCPAGPSLPARQLSEAIRGSLAEWFSVGLLQLRRLTWEHTSAALLEKVGTWGGAGGW